MKKINISASDRQVSLSEEALWKGFLEGNERCFKHIYYSNYDSMKFYGLKIARDDVLVKEAIQDLFADLWYSRDRLGRINSIKAYLFASLRRSILKRLKKKRRKQAIALEFLNKQPEISFSHEEILMRRSEELLKQNVITKALNNLSKRQKEVVYLKYYEEMSYDEISQVIGIRYQSVLNTLQKSFAKLRQDPVLTKIMFEGVASIIFLIGF